MTKIPPRPAQNVSDLRNAAALMAPEIKRLKSDRALISTDAFRRPADEVDSPLGLVLRNRGRIDVALYCLLALLAKARRGGKYSVKENDRFYATLLGLDDSAQSRRLVRDALKRLEHARLITIKRSNYDNKEITLLQPGTTQGLEGFDSSGTYVTLGGKFWSNAWHAGLSSRALLMLLITVDMHSSSGEYPFSRGGNPLKPHWISPGAADRSYGLSHDTRYRGWRELYDQGVVQLESGTTWQRGPGKPIQRNKIQVITAGFNQEPDLELVELSNRDRRKGSPPS